MDFLRFDNVSYTYPPVNGELETDENGNPIIPALVFDYFSAELPASFTSLIGPNASGKSTFMLLAAGRIKPQQGKAWLFGKDIAALDEVSRSNLASFIYQNMEFEQDDPVKGLLEQVHANGSNGGKNGLLDEVIKVFELDRILDRRLTGISKGEIQRVLMAFSILYGSSSVFMDEPMFAMEDRQKEKSMEYLHDYSVRNSIPMFIAMHELDLSRRYSENVLLFYPDRNMDFGAPAEILTKDALEKAYGVPAAMLRETESLNRKALNEAAETMRKATDIAALNANS